MNICKVMMIPNIQFKHGVDSINIGSTKKVFSWNFNRLESRVGNVGQMILHHTGTTQKEAKRLSQNILEPSQQWRMLHVHIYIQITNFAFDIMVRANLFSVSGYDI